MPARARYKAKSELASATSADEHLREGQTSADGCKAGMFLDIFRWVSAVLYSLPSEMQREEKLIPSRPGCVSTVQTLNVAQMMNIRSVYHHLACTHDLTFSKCC